MLTLKQIQKLAPHAFREAIERYGEKGDVEGALIFYTAAIGLMYKEPTEYDLKWAKQFVERITP